MAHAKREKQQSDQFQAFRKAAREAGADATDEQFKDALRTLAKAKPAPQPKKGKGA
jgi:hypothetical protein